MPMLVNRLGAALVTLASSALACGGPSAPPAEPSTGSVTPVVSEKGAEEVVNVALGDFHSCAVVGKARRVYCWGRNRGGELGDTGAGGDRSTPVVVEGVQNIEELAAGADFTCARASDKSVRCWGSGRIFGDARQTERIAPTPLDVHDAMELKAGGYVLCARLGSGEARCWGNADASKRVPSGKVVELAVAATHACARMSDATVRCWGEGPWSGARGVSFSDPKLTGVRTLSTGDSFACAVAQGSEVVCWGRNDQGELGTSPDEDNHEKVLSVRGLSAAPSRLSSGESHTCAILPGGDVWCWGANTEGELARGTRTTQELAGPAPGLAAVDTVAIGTDHACARTRDGALYCWGANRSGQLGDGSTERRLAPVRVRF